MIFGERLIPVSWAIAALAMAAYLGNYVFGPAMAVEAAVPAVVQADAWVTVLSNALSAIPPTIAALAALWVSISSNRKVRDIGMQSQDINDKTIVNTRLVEELKAQNDVIHTLVNSRLTDALGTIEDLKSMLLEMAGGKSGEVPEGTRKRAKAAVKKAS